MQMAHELEAMPPVNKCLTPSPNSPTHLPISLKRPRFQVSATKLSAQDAGHVITAACTADHVKPASGVD